MMFKNLKLSVHREIHTYEHRYNRMSVFQWKRVNSFACPIAQISIHVRSYEISRLLGRRGKVLDKLL